MRFHNKANCPASALTWGRGKSRTIERGRLCESGVAVACIFLEGPRLANVRFTLDAYLPKLDAQIVTIRFKTSVCGVECEPSCKPAFRFFGRGRSQAWNYCCIRGKFAIGKGAGSLQLNSPKAR